MSKLCVVTLVLVIIYHVCMWSEHKIAAALQSGLPSSSFQNARKKKTDARVSVRRRRERGAHTSGTGLPVLQESRVGSRSGPLRRIPAARVPRWRRSWVGSCCRSSSLTAASVRARSLPPRWARPRLHECSATGVTFAGGLFPFPACVRFAPSKGHTLTAGRRRVPGCPRPAILDAAK